MGFALATLFSIARAVPSEAANDPKDLSSQNADDANVFQSTGQAHLRLEIEIPMGTGGSEPDLALTYTSSLSMGPFGVGWKLELGEIRRSARFGTPSYDDSEDAFEFDGVLLVEGPVQGTAAVEYRTVQESFARIVHFRDDSKDGDFWEVRFPDGRIARFGINQECRIRTGGDLAPEDDDGAIGRWLLSELEDASGNITRFRYDRSLDVGTAYPRAVEYTYRNGSLVGGVERRVEFELESRDDAYLGFPAGLETRISRRVKEVRSYIRHGSTAERVHRRYALKYAGSDRYSSTGKSRLESVQAFGSDCRLDLDTTSCEGLPEKKFTYTDTTPAIPDQSGSQWDDFDWGGGSSLAFTQASGKDRGVRIGDVNGDGLPDFVRAHHRDGEPDQHEVYLSDGQGWGSSDADWGDALAALTVDAFEIREIRPNDEVTCAIVDPPTPVQYPVSFAFDGLYTSLRIRPLIQANLVDLNADGFADILLSFEVGGGAVSADAPCVGAPYHWDPAPQVKYVWINKGKAAPDFPGDPDFGWERRDDWATSLPPFYSIFLWTDAGSDELDRPGRAFPPGDNRTGLIGNNTTLGTAAYYFDHGVRMPDLNGDGRPDIVANRSPAYFGMDAPVVTFPKGAWLSKADGVGWEHFPGSTSAYLPPAPIVAEFGHKADNAKFVMDADNGVRFVDLNGDGLADIVKTAVGPIQNTNWRFEHQPLPPAMLEEGVWLNTGEGWCGPGDARCAAAQSYLPRAVLPGVFTEVYAACNFVTRGGVPPDPSCVKHARVRGTEFRFTDLNGDGLVDLLRTDDPEFYGLNAWLQDPSDPAIWRQDQRFVPADVMATIRAKRKQQQFGSYEIEDSGVRIFDFDGDATVDLLRHETGVERQMFVSRTAFLDLLAEFDNGQGGIQEFTYRSAIAQRDPDFEAVAGADAVDPVFGEAGEIGIPRWTARAVVSRLVASDTTAGGSTHATALKYAMPRWDPAMRSQLGFRAVEASVDGSSKTRTFFWQKFGRAGRASRVVNFDADGTPLRQKLALWEVIPGSDLEGSIADTYIGRIVAEESANLYDSPEGVAAGSTQSIRYRYADEHGDSYGYNFVHGIEISRPSGTLSIARTPVPAAGESGKWIVGQLASETHRDEGGDLLKETQYSYDGSMLIEVRKTLMLRHEEGASSFSDVAIDYDEYGNRVSQTDPEGRITYACYDGDTFFQDGSACPDEMGEGSHTVIVGVKEPNGDVTKFIREPGSGTAIESTRLYSGDSSYVDLDRFGRPERLWTQPEGHGTAKILSERNYVDDLAAAGRPYREQWDYFAESTGTDQSAAVRGAVYLDGFGRESVRVSPRAPGHEHPFGRAITRRDHAGRPLRVTLDLACEYADCRTLPTYTGSAAISQTYDALGRVLSRTTPDGVTAFGYRAASLDLPVGSGVGTTVSLDAILMKDPNGNLTEHIFDGDRLIEANECRNAIPPEQTDLAEVVCADPDSTFYTYEASGELAAIYDAHPNQDFASPARNFRYDYDTLGRVWKTSDPDRGVSYTGRDRVGNVVQTIDARGRSIRYQYDALDRVERIDTPGDAGDWNQLEISYDPDTRKRSHVTAAGMTYSESWEYDDFGNLEKNVRTVIGRTLRRDFAHDLLGRLKTLKSPLSSRDSVHRVYDSAYLTTICSAPDSSSCAADPRVSYVDGVVYDAVGRAKTISGPGGDLSYDYYEVEDPAAGRAVDRLKSMALDGSRLNFAYRYDRNENVVHIADNHTGDALNSTADYAYDRRNRLVAWTGADQVEKHFSYDSIGNLVGRNLPAAAGSADEWNQIYDYANKPHALRMNWNDRGYDYDAAGNVVRRGEEYFTYNSLGQLHCVGPSEGSCADGVFWYDIDGNLMTKTVGSGSEIYLGDDFRFDKRSNSAWVYTRAFGRRIAVTHQSGAVLRAEGFFPNGPLFIARDPLYRWLAALGLLGGLALLARWGAFEAIAERPVSASIALALSVVVVAPPPVWAARRGRARSTEIRYLFHDHLGSEILSVDASGELEERRVFEPFGEVIASQGMSAASAPAIFTGKRFHEEASLYHFGARWYDAEGGRFASVDPIAQSVGDPQTHNPYGYVRNNPICLVDPNGREIFTAIAVAAVVAKIAYYAALVYTAYDNVQNIVSSSNGGSTGPSLSERQDAVVAQNTLTANGEPARKSARSTARNYGRTPEPQGDSFGPNPDNYIKLSVGVDFATPLGGFEVDFGIFVGRNQSGDLQAGPFVEGGAAIGVGLSLDVGLEFIENIERLDRSASINFVEGIGPVNAEANINPVPSDHGARFFGDFVNGFSAAGSFGPLPAEGFISATHTSAFDAIGFGRRVVQRFAEP